MRSSLARRTAAAASIAAALASVAATPAEAARTKCSGTAQGGVLRSLSVERTSCVEGRKVMRAWGRSQGARRVLGYRVTARYVGEEDSGVVGYITARKGSRVIRFQSRN